MLGKNGEKEDFTARGAKEKRAFTSTHFWQLCTTRCDSKVSRWKEGKRECTYRALQLLVVLHAPKGLSGAFSVTTACTEQRVRERLQRGIQFDRMYAAFILR